jgi:hypothetical protein
MRLARRAAGLAVLLLLAGLGLAGCRSQPGVAAYVGTTEYSEEQVEAIVDEVRDQVVEGRLGNVRRDVLSWLVLSDLGRRVAAEQRITVPAPDYQGIAEQARLPAGTALARAYADWVAVANTLIQRVQPVPPTEADIRAIYDVLRDSGRLPEGMSLQEVAAQVNNTGTAQLVGLRNLLAQAAARHELTINPRYRPLTVSLGELPLPLAAGSDAVTELVRT